MRNKILQDVIDYINIHHPGAKCLATEYINNSTKMLIECEHKHQWEIHFGNIKAGRWCPYCSGKLFYIEDIAKILSENFPGYKLITGNKKKNLEIECDKGHVFFKDFVDVRNNNRICPECIRLQMPTIESIREFIDNNHPGGSCLSEKFVACEKKLLFQCKNKHTWETLFRNIQKGHWCPHCIINKKKDIEFIKNFVKEKYGGECLSEEYINKDHKLKLRCKQGHEWESSYGVFRECWCPICAISSGERFCKYTFEKLFGYEFNTIRPEFLRYFEGNNRKLELDGYCQELNFAFEYQGRQHYQIVDKFKMTKEILKQQQERDEIKRKKCKEHKTKLIEVPYFSRKFKQENLKDYIKSECIRLNINLPNNTLINIIAINKDNHNKVNEYLCCFKYS